MHKNEKENCCYGSVAYFKIAYHHKDVLMKAMFSSQADSSLCWDFQQHLVLSWPSVNGNIKFKQQNGNPFVKCDWKIQDFKLQYVLSIHILKQITNSSLLTKYLIYVSHKSLTKIEKPIKSVNFLLN